MKLFNKNYFQIYKKQWNIFWFISEKIRKKEDCLSKYISFLNPALHIIFKLPKLLVRKILKLLI